MLSARHQQLQGEGCCALGSSLEASLPLPWLPAMSEPSARLVLVQAQELQQASAFAPERGPLFQPQRPEQAGPRSGPAGRALLLLLQPHERDCGASRPASTWAKFFSPWKQSSPSTLRRSSLWGATRRSFGRIFGRSLASRHWLIESGFHHYKKQPVATWGSLCPRQSWCCPTRSTCVRS